MPQRTGRLLRVLGVGFGVAVSIGSTVGAGIFRVPGEVAALLPDPRWFLAAWAAGGAYAWLGALQVAELGTMLPRSGGQYVFVRHALGEYAGFIVGWSDWISTCGATAAVALVIAEYSARLVPAFSGRVASLAAFVTIVFALAQWRGTRGGQRLQNVTSALKGAAFAILIAAAFVFGGHPAAPSAFALPVASVGLATAFVLAVQGVIFTYDGWTGIVYFSEEVEHPATDIPRSLIGGIALIVVMYLLTNAAFLYAVALPAIAGEPFAAGIVAERLFGHRGELALYLLTIVSMLSGVNANNLMASRVLFAMSRDGLVARRAASVNAGGTPDVALWTGTLVAVLFIVLGQTFARIITVLAFFYTANYALSFTSLFVLRRREPSRPRPYRAWGYPWTTGLALAGSVAFLLGAIAGDTRNSVYAVALLAMSYPIYRVLKRRVGHSVASV